MNPITKIVYLIFVTLALTACFSTGTKIQPDQSASFVKGQTTMLDVEAAIGKPQTISVNSDGTTIWSYVYADTDVNAATYIPIVGIFAGGAKTEMQTLVITFDSSEVIADWTQSDTVTETKNY